MIKLFIICAFITFLSITLVVILLLQNTKVE